MSYLNSDRGPSADEARQTAIANADDAVQNLHNVFFATPYRPGGLTTGARAVIRLVDELRWLNGIVVRSAPKEREELSQG